MAKPPSGPHTKVTDPLFDRRIGLGDAYRIMERFVSDYLDRGDTPVLAFLVYLSLDAEGRSMDPAALDDFLAAAREVLGEPAADPGT